ncbi:MAG: hypothetical protein ABIQ53_16845 [Terracoccus sp.]
MSEDSVVTHERVAQLEHDQSSEDRLLWKGVLALAGAVALAFARQRWWI